MVSVAIDTMYENCPSTTSGRPGRKNVSSRPHKSSARLATRLASARMEMPRITPGITSGASISSDKACLPRNCVRSMRKALAVPTPTVSTVTQQATTTLVHRLPSRAVSANRPRRALCALPTNQSSVKPRQGGAG